MHPSIQFEVRTIPIEIGRMPYNLGFTILFVRRTRIHPENHALFDRRCSGIGPWVHQCADVNFGLEPVRRLIEKPENPSARQ